MDRTVSIGRATRERGGPLPLPGEFMPLRAGSWKYLSPADLKGLKNLLFAARVIVEGAYAGRHRSPYKGSAAEFVDYREYYPGDELRSVDWKAYARTDRYFVKLFERETDMNCQMLIDHSASMAYGGKEFDAYFPTRELSKLEYASYLAAALAFLLVKQGDRVGMTLFDDKVNVHAPAGSTFPHLYSLLNVLEGIRPGRRTSVAKALRDTFTLQKRRGLLVVISDFLDDPAEIFRALDMYRHRRFEILLYHVLHRYEVGLPPIENVDFIDAESGETLTVRPADIAEGYERELRRFIHTMSSNAKARAIDYVFLDTSTPYPVALQKYLLFRSAL